MHVGYLQVNWIIQSFMQKQAYNKSLKRDLQRLALLTCSKFSDSGARQKVLSAALGYLEEKVNMEITFRKISIDDDFDLCVEARKDAYFCSFGHYDGFDDFISGYRERVRERLTIQAWFYIHIFVAGQFAGQLEFRSFSSEPDTGYVHLIYLKPNFRGLGLASKLQDYIVKVLSKAGCKRAVLSVSRTNARALAFYKSHGWEFVRKNPKHDETDFYQLWLYT